MDVMVALAGTGNCAFALVQGVNYNKKAQKGDVGQGMTHLDFGGYYVRGTHSAFEVNKLKIGEDLSEAIFMEPNCCARFINPVPKMKARVLPGLIIDGVAATWRNCLV